MGSSSKYKCSAGGHLQPLSDEDVVPLRPCVSMLDLHLMLWSSSPSLVVAALELLTVTRSSSCSPLAGCTGLRCRAWSSLSCFSSSSASTRLLCVHVALPPLTLSSLIVCPQDCPAALLQQVRRHSEVSGFSFAASSPGHQESRSTPWGIKQAPRPTIPTGSLLPVRS